MLINFPCNPTGGVMSHEDYAKLVPIIKKHQLIVISDEIYAELTYDGTFASLAQFDEIKDQVIVISGFSKAFAMTGWRLGYVVARPAAAMNRSISTSSCLHRQRLNWSDQKVANGWPHVEEMVRSYPDVTVSSFRLQSHRFELL
ncbi:MAG: aminotransferase class I/II-fold pyridoxal phosphate-dependent enzyme [Merdibacter sp.]